MEDKEVQKNDMADSNVSIPTDENFRRRTAKERIELIQTAGKDVIVSLLDLMDDCDRAEKQLQSGTDIAVQKEGIQLVFNKIRSTLQSKGLKAMESILIIT